MADPIPAPSLPARALSPLAASLGRFLAVGCAGLAVDMTVFNGLAGLGLPFAAARALSLAAATGVTWRLNRRFTFGPSARTAPVEAGRYALVALLAQGFNWALFLALCAALPGVSPTLLIGVSAACATVFSFTGQRLFTFTRVR